MKRILSVLVLCTVSLLPVLADTQWPIEYYSRYSFSDYTDYAPFNARIESTGYDADLLEAAVFYETNRQRALNGKSQFLYEYKLEVCAHNHSVDMVNYDFFDHDSPVAGKHSMSDRFAEAEIQSMSRGENIALRTISTSYAETARLLLNQWMNSPGHRANILDDRFTHLGCGVAFYHDGSFVYVKATQNFMGGYLPSKGSSQKSAVSYQPSEVSHQQSEVSHQTSGWTAEEKRIASTAANASYMSEIEKDVMMYLNLARLYPKKFALLEVENYEHAQGYTVYPTFPQYKKSLLETLYSMETVGALRPDYDCYEMAYCWAEESSRYRVRGHNRINCKGGYSAECCSYGVYTAIDIVLQLLIDDPVPSLGHRKSCLSGGYSKLGISHMKHPTEDHVTVLDFK